MPIDRERLARVLEAHLVEMGALKHEKGDWTFGPSWVAVNAILSEIAAQGYVIVPEVPTKEMVEAGIASANDAMDSDWDSGPDGESYNSYTYLRSDAPSSIYQAMIQAGREE